MNKRLAAKPIAITSGDHRGIGPEVIAKTLATLKPSELSRLVIFGTPELYYPFRSRILKNRLKKWILWTEDDLLAKDWPGPVSGYLNFVAANLGHVPASKSEAYACGRYIELAARGALKGTFSAVVTGPIDKNELRRGGYAFDGHTEMLQKLCKAPSVTMMLAGPAMRVTLATVHVPLKDVSKRLTTEKVVTCISNTVQGLKRDFQIPKPRIAVLGLNPHAGDSGLFGNEEKLKITPAIARARKRFPGCHIEGPFPPDGFFAQWQRQHHKTFDAIVCMYHDQGLIPAKLLDFEHTVNVSLGLPIVRTSVDHGVGYDIAGKNKADPTSMQAALRLASQIVRRRA